MAPYHSQSVCYIKADDPDLPAFYYDPIINPLPAYRAVGHRSQDQNAEDDEEIESFKLPEDCKPLLEDTPLFTDTTANGITLPAG